MEIDRILMHRLNADMMKTMTLKQKPFTIHLYLKKILNSTNASKVKNLNKPSTASKCNSIIN